MFLKEQIEFLHNTGKMPDWAYYQQNRNSIAENYREQKAKIYREIRQDTVQKLQETEIEKLQELKTLIQSLTVNARIVTDGASNLIQVRGNLKTDKQKMVHFLEQQIQNQDESYLRQYRENLPHL